MILLALALLQHPACGVERITIKDLTDRGRSAIHWTPESTTVAALRALPAPHPLPPTRRVPPIETQVYRLHALGLGIKLETDRDYHLVIAEPSDTSLTMIAEAPDPICINKPLDSLAALMAVRQTLQARFHPTAKYQRFPKPVPLILTGVGFL